SFSRRSSMFPVSFLGALARGQVRLDARPMAFEVSADEDRLRLARLRIEPEPGDLVAAAREVEERVPVAAGEADDALRPKHVLREAREQPLERFLAEGARATPD